MLELLALSFKRAFGMEGFSGHFWQMVGLRIMEHAYGIDATNKSLTLGF